MWRDTYGIMKVCYTKLNSWIETVLVCQNKFFTCRISVCISLWHCSELSSFSLSAVFLLLTLESKRESKNEWRPLLSFSFCYSNISITFAEFSFIYLYVKERKKKENTIIIALIFQTVISIRNLSQDVTWMMISFWRISY